MQIQVVNRGRNIPSTPLANTNVVKNDKEEDTGVANAAKLKWSIVEVVVRVGNKVGVVVKNSDMVAGPLVSKEAS